MEILNLKAENYKQFKAWVENTKLFQVIVAHSGIPFCEGIEGFEENSSLFLAVSGRKITTFEELPIEVLHEFYINSPFYTKT